MIFASLKKSLSPRTQSRVNRLPVELPRIQLLWRPLMSVMSLEAINRSIKLRPDSPLSTRSAETAVMISDREIAMGTSVAPSQTDASLTDSASRLTETTCAHTLKVAT